MKRINYSFYTLILTALVISLIMLALLHKVSPLFFSKTLFICQKFITDIMLKLPRSLPGAFILTISFVLGIGLMSFLLQLGRTHLLLRKLLTNKAAIPKKLAGIVTALGLTNKVILVNDSNLISFCCGIFSPSIIITTALVRSLTAKELEAVLLHEQSHLLSRDPLKVLIGKTFSLMFFFLPIFRELHKNIESVNELLADQWTIKYQQESTFLRRALKKILASPLPDLDFISHVSGPDYFEIRIHRLVNPGINPGFKLSLVSLSTTLLFVFVGWFLLQTPVDAFTMKSKADPADLLIPEQRCALPNDNSSLTKPGQVYYTL